MSSIWSLVNGASLLVKGLTYAPMSIGQRFSEFLPNDARIYTRDIPLLRTSGANVVRTYARSSFSQSSSAVWQQAEWGVRQSNLSFTLLMEVP